MKILLTGSGGFIGRNLKTALEEQFQGEEIVVLKRKEKNGSLARGESTGESLVDYSDPQTLLDCKNCWNTDMIIHVAGGTKLPFFSENYYANVVPTKNLLEALKQKSPNLQRFVLLSSHAAAGPSRYKKREDEPNRPVNFYGLSKLIAEWYAMSYASTMPVTILRPSSVYGPGDVDFLNIYKMAAKAIHGKSLNVYAGNKERYTSIIYIDDLVKGIVTAMLSPKTTSQCFFVCNKNPEKWKTIHETIFETMGVEPISFNMPSGIIKPISYVGNVMAFLTGEPSLFSRDKFELSYYNWVASNELLERATGFTPKVSLEDGIRLTYESYKSTGQL